MDFQILARRELQALCKLNKIPANITNVSMVDALTSLDMVVGIEDFLKPSESLETNESSVESPVRNEIMSPKVPRTGYRTSTRQKPVKEEAEPVQTVTRTTRRGVRRLTSGEVEDSKTATVPVTPAAVSTRRRASVASARKYMETQLKESKEDVKVEESMNQVKKSVPVTPAAVVPTSRRKGPTASTTLKVNVKEESMLGRTYSTRRSARLAKVAEPSPVEKESKNVKKINSLSSQSFEEMLDDESSDVFNEVAEESSLSVDIESKGELLEVKKEKASGVDTDMGTEDAAAIATKNDVLENMGSNDMEVDVIPSNSQGSSELNKLENVENPDRDMGSEEAITEVNKKTGFNNMEVDVIPSDIQNPSELIKLENAFNPETDVSSELAIYEVIKTAADDIASEIENPSEDSKLEAAEYLVSHEDMDSVDVAAADMENKVVLDNKEGDDYPSAIENSSVTFEQEIVGTDEESDADNSSEALKQEDVGSFDDIESDEETAVVMETMVLENNKVENLNETEEANISLTEEPLVDGVESRDLEKIESRELNSIESDVEIQILEKNGSAVENENQEESFEFPILCLVEDTEFGLANESDVTNISADFSSFSLTSIPNSEVDAVIAKDSSTPLKKSAAKMPSQARKMAAFVSDDKENIDQSETKLQLTNDVGMEPTISTDQLKVLNDASLRQLKKMFKEKLQITSKIYTNADETNAMAKVPKTARPALQTLSSNSLAATETQGN